jgi:hypothetical protein
MFPKIKLWYMYCSTGCSCCANENFYQGFYKTEDEASKIKEEYKRGNGNPLASQYSKYGNYKIHETEAELLPDGRMIINNSIVLPQDHKGRFEW